MEKNIPKVVVIHRNYVEAMPLGTRHSRRQHNYMYSDRSHTADFLAWMNLHVAWDITTEWRLDAPGVDREIDANWTAPLGEVLTFQMRFLGFAAVLRH